MGKNNTIESEGRKYKKLEAAYELEKQKDKEPATLLAERDRKHRREMKTTKEDYERQITENKEEIQNLKNVAQARINDNKKIYDTIASKNEDIETLQNTVLVLERDVRRKHREME